MRFMVGIVTAAVCVWIAIGIAYVYGSMQGVDGAVMRFFVSIRNEVLTPIIEVITDLDGLRCAMLFVAGIVAMAVIIRRYHVALYMSASSLGAAFWFVAIKHLFKRDRPPYMLIEQGGYSFPSGHATMAAAVSFALFYIVWCEDRRKRWRFAFGVVAVFWTGLIATTRLYLGVHWFSDVVAGAALGAGWASLLAIWWCRTQK